MLSGNRQLDSAKLFSVFHNIKFGASVVESNIRSGIFRLILNAEGDKLLIVQLVYKGCRFRIIGTNNSALRIIYILRKGSAKLLHIFKVIGVIVFNIGYNCRSRDKRQKRIAVFASLKDKKAFISDTVSASHIFKLRSADNGRIKSLRYEYFGYHRCHRALAVRTGYTDPFSIAAHKPT